MTDHNQRNTVTELIPAVGAAVDVRFEGLTVTCAVLDAKNSWGKVRLLVAPLAGAGDQWIELGRLVRDEEADRAADEAARAVATSMWGGR
jgi:hypothetical protein